METQALVPRFFIATPTSSSWRSIVITGLSVLSLCLLAQLTLPLPWTPVPISGQTFGISLFALLLGSRLSLASTSAYLLLGTLGLPVFASGSSGIGGPTTGYLFGMLLSSTWIGFLADRGWTRTYRRCWTAGFSGSLIVYLCGCAWLSRYVPLSDVAISGFFPFIPGDLLKTGLACSLVPFVEKRLGKQDRIVARIH